MSVLLLTSGSPDNLLLADGASNLLLAASDTVDIVTPAAVVVTVTVPAPTLIDIAAPAAVAATATVPSPTIVSFPDAVDSAPPIGYQIVIVSRDGTRHAEFVAKPTKVVWELNGLGSAGFQAKVDDTLVAAQFQTVTREIQVWRNRRKIWQGPIVRSSFNRSWVTAECRGLGWYLTRRHVGTVRSNRLTNGSFETDAVGATAITGWTVTNIDARAVVTNNRRIGTKALQVNNFDDLNGYIEQSYVVPAADRGKAFVPVLEFYIAENLGGAPAWSGPAYQERGLWLSMFRTSDSEFLGLVEAKITNDTREEWSNKWFRLEAAPLVTPKDVGVTLKYRGYAPGAWCVIDSCRLVADEALEALKVDQTEIARLLVVEAQNTTNGKSDLGILTNTAPSGVIRERRYPWDEYVGIWDALAEFPQLDDGFDFDFDIDSRTFTTYYPQKGATHTNLVLELGKNLVDYTVVEDGEQAANSTIALGVGSGPARDEAKASDSGTLGGMILEETFQAQRGAHIGFLDGFAADRLAKRKNVPKLLTVTTHEGAEELIGVLQTGDTLPVRISHGAVDIDDVDYRVTRIELDPANEQLTLSLVAA